jgi:hypothetical protein
VSGRSGSNKTSFRDNVPLAREKHRRALHQAPRRGVERLAAMHGEAIVPQERIADPPMVAIDELGSGREVVDLFEQGRL